jgi:hypothetical protein
LERRIVCCPAFTAQGLSAKLWILEKTDFVGGDHDTAMLVQTIIDMDSERIAALYEEQTRHRAACEHARRLING